MSDSLQDFRTVIRAHLGYAPEVIEPGKMHRFATSDKRGDDAGWCKLFPDERGSVFGCFRLGISEWWRASDHTSMTRSQRAEQARQVEAATRERERMQQQQWASNAQRIDQTWSDCVPLVPDDPVTLYLRRRGFAGVWPLPSCLRLHRAMPYWDGDKKAGVFAAMVAPLLAPSGRIVALHRTYLTTDGRKADVPSPKKLTATAGPLGGACIPLHAPRAGVVGIAEGVETALAAWLASDVPTVAAYCTSLLAAWQWPTSARRIVIFGDNDHAGREAADRLRARALAAGLRCDMHMPSDDGADWCDVWATRSVIEEAMA